MFVIVMITFGVKDALGVADIFNIFTDAGTNEMILEPTVRPFDFTFGLRG